MVRYAYHRFAIAMAAALLLVGCATQEAKELLPVSFAPVAANAIAAKHEIYIATTRGESEKPAEVYDR